MATSEERLKILKMVQEGKISPEEAARLLSALAKAERKRAAASPGEGRWLRVRVTDVDSGKTTVNVNLPVSLVNVGLRMGARFVPEMEGVSMTELDDAIRKGLTGKIIDIVDEAERQRVEVYVE
jgi:hypothetical protein